MYIEQGVFTVCRFPMEGRFDTEAFPFSQFFMELFCQQAGFFFFFLKTDRKRITETKNDQSQTGSVVW